MLVFRVPSRRSGHPICPLPDSVPADKEVCSVASSAIKCLTQSGTHGFFSELIGQMVTWPHGSTIKLEGSKLELPGEALMTTHRISILFQAAISFFCLKSHIFEKVFYLFSVENFGGKSQDINIM